MFSHMKGWRTSQTDTTRVENSKPLTSPNMVSKHIRVGANERDRGGGGIYPEKGILFYFSNRG